MFETARPYEITAGTRLRVTILQNYVHQQALGRFRLFVTGDDGALHADPRPVAIDALLAKGAAARTDDERKALRNYYLSVAPDLGQYNAEIQRLRDSRPRVSHDVRLQGTAEREQTSNAHSRARGVPTPRPGSSRSRARGAAFVVQ